MGVATAQRYAQPNLHMGPLFVVLWQDLPLGLIVSSQKTRSGLGAKGRLTDTSSF